MTDMPQAAAATPELGSGDVGALLVTAAATGLRSVAPAPNVGDEVAPRWLRAVGRAALSGHAVQALASGDLIASDDVVREVSRLHLIASMRVLQLERMLVRVTDLLRDAGVELRVLKGPALARTVYAHAGFRTFADVDVLVRSSDFDRATGLLADGGYTRMLPELRPGFDRRFAKSATFVDDRGCQVDLHRTLVVGPFGLMVDAGDLFRTCQVIDVAGRRLRALGPDEQFLNVCYHAALGDVPPRLSTLRDVAQMLVSSRVDPVRVQALAQRWGGTSVVARAIRLAWTVLGGQAGPPLAEWAFAYEPGRRERRLLAAYTSAHRSNSHKYLASARVIPGARAKFDYLQALLMPERSFVRRRTRDRHRWWLHGLASFARRSDDTPMEPS